MSTGNVGVGKALRGRVLILFPRGNSYSRRGIPPFCWLPVPAALGR